MKYTNFIGIDVSKYKVDIFMTDGNLKATVTNTKEPLTKYFKKIKSEGSFVVVENTGGYEKIVIKVLLKLGFSIHVANNNKVKAFIASYGQKSKTDAIDASMLAMYGKDRHNILEIYKAPGEEFETMKQIASYVISLKETLVAQKNIAQSPGSDLIGKEVAKLTEFITNEIKDLETKLQNMVKSDKNLKKKSDLMCKYKGIREATAAQLLVLLPELGDLPKRFIVSLSGLAPHANDSGTIKKHRTTRKGGRQKTKPIMYMPTLSALRYNPVIKKFFDRLCETGKKKKVALIACMKKIIIHLNAILRDGEIRYATQ